MENRQVAWPCSRLERSRSGFAHLALISPESGPDRALDGTKDTWRWLIADAGERQMLAHPATLL
jgi:hypothetical protein